MKRLNGLWLIALTLLAACAGAAPVPPKEITLEAQDIAFGSPALEVALGQPVRLTLRNTGVLEHDFNVAAIAVNDVKAESTGHSHGSGGPVALHVAAVPGGSARLDFTPLEPGRYEFYCSTAGHKEAGMTGTLIVNDS